MGVVLCMNSKVANKRPNMRPCGVFGAACELEGEKMSRVFDGPVFPFQR